MHKHLKAVIFIIAGIAVGSAFASFKSPDYRHVSLVLKEGANQKPVGIGNYNGKQVIALSIKNLQYAKDIEIRAEGAKIESWYPPIVKMPFGKWMSAAGGKFTGLESGRRLPLYLTIDGRKCREMEFIDSSKGTIIQTVHFMKGGSDAGHH